MEDLRRRGDSRGGPWNSYRVNGDDIYIYNDIISI